MRRKSHSLPSLVSTSTGRSPLDFPQALCSVDISTKLVSRSSVGGGGVAKISKEPLTFATFERGLEWERPHVVARVPKERLPPLGEVMQMAISEFDLQLPDRSNMAATAHRGQRLGQSATSASSSSRGPRLPIRGRDIDGLVKRRPHRARTEKAPEPPSVKEEVPEPQAKGTKREGLGHFGTTVSMGSPRNNSMVPFPSFDAKQLSASPSRANGHAQSSSTINSGANADEEWPLPWTKEELQKAFTKLDSDRDGELQIEELPALLRCLGARPQSGDAERICREMTPYATLSQEECVQFISRFREVDRERMRQQFEAADQDGNGCLDFNELHCLVQELGYAPTVEATKEAFDLLDKDRNDTIDFKEFEGLRDHLRTTQGFTRADASELQWLHQRTGLAKLSSTQSLVEQIWRITTYLGFPSAPGAVEEFCQEVDPDSTGEMNFKSFCSVVRLLRDDECAKLLYRAALFGGAIDSAGRPALLREHLVPVLLDLGYFANPEAVDEVFREFKLNKANSAALAAAFSGMDEGDVVRTNADRDGLLLWEEFASFMGCFRKSNGFTAAERVEMEESFHKHCNVEVGGLRTLEASRVLRWFGFPQPLQRLQWQIEETDLDDSGVLELGEFMKLLRKLHMEGVEQRNKVFSEMATPSAKGQKELPVARLGDAVGHLESVKPDPERVEAATERMLRELGSRPDFEGCPEATAEAKRTVFVNRVDFEAFFRHYCRLVVEEVRTGAGYSSSEKSLLWEAFNQYDEDKNGVIERGEFVKLITAYFPDSTKSRTGQREVQRALLAADADAHRGLDFGNFLGLMRHCDDARDCKDLELERQFVRECNWQREEVEGYRQIFSAHADWTGELDLENLVLLLGPLVEMSEDALRDLSTLVKEVHPEGRQAARFPQFLRLVERLTQENYGRVNDEAARIVRRQQQKPWST